MCECARMLLEWRALCRDLKNKIKEKKKKKKYTAPLESQQRECELGSPSFNIWMAAMLEERSKQKDVWARIVGKK